MNEHAAAEMVALKMLVLKLTSGVASALNGKRQQPAQFYSELQATGERDLDALEFLDAVPVEQQEAFKEQAKAYYSQLVDAVATGRAAK